MIVGCYSLHLYCDREAAPVVYREPIPPGAHLYDEFPHEFQAETGSACRTQARKRGWQLRANRAICPRCAKAGETHHNIDAMDPPRDPVPAKDEREGH